MSLVFRQNAQNSQENISNSHSAQTAIIDTHLKFLLFSKGTCLLKGKKKRIYVTLPVYSHMKNAEK